MNTTQTTPEVATGTEVGEKVKTINSRYVSDCRLAGRLAEDVAKAAAVEFDRYGDCHLLAEFSPDGITIKKNGRRVPFSEEVVEIPTPPWSSSGYDPSGMSSDIPGWRVYKSEMMEIISAWVKSVI